MPSEPLSMLKERERNKSCSSQYQRSWLNSWELCRSTTTLVSLKSLMTIEARRLWLSWLAASTNAELSVPDTISYFLTSRSGPATSSHPDNLDTLSYPPPRESSHTKSAEKDTSVAKSSVSSIDDLLWIELFKKIILYPHGWISTSTFMTRSAAFKICGASVFHALTNYQHQSKDKFYFFNVFGPLTKARFLWSLSVLENNHISAELRSFKKEQSPMQTTLKIVKNKEIIIKWCLVMGAKQSIFQ